MHIQSIDRASADLGAQPSAATFLDPLDPDRPGDAVVVTSKRSLVRLALAAAETATRFAREGDAIDPMSWMMAPRRLFDGRTAMDACLELDGCLRAVLLHGLAMGMDADPAFVDGLVDDEDIDHPSIASDDDGGRRLWTSYLAGRSEEESVQAFDAVVARDRSEAEVRLSARHGAALADGLEIVEGFDARLPPAEALVSPAPADVLEQAAADLGSPVAEGLSITVQQRFTA